MDRRRSASAGYSSARTTAAWRATSSRSGSTSGGGGSANASSVARVNAVRPHKRVSRDASSASAWSSIAARAGRGGDETKSAVSGGASRCATSTYMGALPGADRTPDCDADRSTLIIRTGRRGDRGNNDGLCRPALEVRADGAHDDPPDQTYEHEVAQHLEHDEDAGERLRRDDVAEAHGRKHRHRVVERVRPRQALVEGTARAVADQVVRRGADEEEQRQRHHDRDGCPQPRVGRVHDLCDLPGEHGAEDDQTEDQPSHGPKLQPAG